MFTKNNNYLSFCTNRLALLEQTISETHSIITEREIEIIGNNNFYGLAELLGLDMDNEIDFIKWPLFLGKEEDDINVCSICFGALALTNQNYAKTPNNKIDQYLNACINSIILLHLRENNTLIKNKAKVTEEFIYWPRNYIVGTTQIEAGTINQTTLSLSTLYKLGFLDTDSPIKKAPIQEKILMERIRFIIKSVNWIIRLQIRDGRTASWSYAEKCKEINNNTEIRSATLPTFYCVETLTRFYRLFTENPQINKIVNSIDDTIIQRIRESCDSSISFFKIKQNDDGGFYKSSNSLRSTVFHTCIAGVILSYDESENVYLKKNIAFLTKRFLLGRIIYKADFFEKYKYMVTRIVYIEKEDKFLKNNIKTYDEEAFEVFPESMVIISSLRLLEHDDNLGNKIMNSFQRKVFKEKIYNSYNRMFKRFYIDKGCLYVKGRREGELIYPIYNIYYASLSLNQLLTSINQGEKIITIPITRLIMYILIVVIVLSLFISAIVIDKVSTGFWLVTTAIGLIVSTVIQYIIRNAQLNSIK